MPVGVQYPDEPPELPLVGSANAPLQDLLQWRAEIVAAKRERATAEREREAAVARLEAANRRHREAWENFFQLYTRAVGDKFPPPPRVSSKAKGKERAPPDDGDAEDEEDGSDEEEDDAGRGSMDVS